MTKTEEYVENAGSSDVVVTATPVIHRPLNISREDWETYNADFLHTTWRLIREEAVGFWVLEKATFADWEDFCWKLSKPREQQQYSTWLVEQDEM